MALTVGFLWYGFMVTAHANALARLPMFFPHAPATERRVLIGRNETRLAAAADRRGFSSVSTDWHQVLGDLDLLYNLAPNNLHPEPSLEALDRGVHVLTEKPLAHSLEAAEQMAEAARESEAVGGVGFNYRFLPVIQHARDLIAAGELGEIRTFRGRYLQDRLVDPEAPWSWRNDAELAGSGALGDLGGHTLDLARFLLGDVPGGGTVERVSGHLRTFVHERPVTGDDDTTDVLEDTRPVTVDDAFSAQLAFEGGAMGTVEASRVAPGHKNDHALAVHGTRGSLSFALERLNELAVLGDGNRGYETVPVTNESDPYVDAWWPPGHGLGWEHTFVHESDAFLSAVAGDGEYRPDSEDGLAVQRLLAAIERSDRTGSWTAV
jgi:predicted dehydrogenase